MMNERNAQCCRDPLTIYDFIALGEWLDRAQDEFWLLNDNDHHTPQQATHLSLFAALIARVIKIRSEYLARHNP